LSVVGLGVVCLGFVYAGRAYWAWVVGSAGVWADTVAFIRVPLTDAAALGGGMAVIALVFGVPSIRSRLVAPLLMRWIGPMLPVLRDTQRIALEAGTVWWDGELFSGAPDWN